VNVCMGSQYLSVTHIYRDTQSHKCVRMVELSGEYGNTWVFGTLILRYPWIFEPMVLRYLWFYGLLGVRNLVPLDLRKPGFTVPWRVRNPGLLGCSEPWIYGTLRSSDSIELRREPLEASRYV
jgi:hypothetical protein